ncbi:MAG: phosphoribosylanthranilate isomerase [Chakrabartia sp.]
MSPIQAKICGVTTPEAIAAALAGGATHLGFVFVSKSPRFIAPEKAAALIGSLPSHVKSVGLVVDQSDDQIADLLRLIPQLDALQFHGAEQPAQIARWKAPGREIWKAIPIRTAADLAPAKAYQGTADHLLYDAKPPKSTDLPGGTGQRFDWTILQGAPHPLPWLLAGGLDSTNVAEAHQVTGARFFDVSSGVESAPGIKDVDKIAAFLKATRSL